MPAPIGSDLPTIAKAIETQLTTFVTVTGNPVVGDLTNIYWVEKGEEPPPGQTGQRDIIITEMADDTAGTVEGAGRFATIDSGFDIYLRSQNESDQMQNRRDFFIVHRPLINGLMDALMGFFPEDVNHNALTLWGLVLETNTAPERSRDAATWGYTVARYTFRYLPAINTTVLG